MFSVSASSTHLITDRVVIHVLNGNAGRGAQNQRRVFSTRGGKPISPNHVPVVENTGAVRDEFRNFLIDALILARHERASGEWRAQLDELTSEDCVELPLRPPAIGDEVEADHENYSCVSQLSASAGSITGTGASGYPSDRVSQEHRNRWLRRPAAQTASSKFRPGQRERPADDVVIDRCDGEDANTEYDRTGV